MGSMCPEKAQKAGTKAIDVHLGWPTLPETPKTSLEEDYLRMSPAIPMERGREHNSVPRNL